MVAVVEPALKMVEHDLRHRATLVRRFAPVPTVDAVAGRLEQVLVNLLINAIQALPAGDPTTDEVAVEIAAGDGHVTIAVSDTGAGIPAEDRERVFEPFFTTKPIGEGTGLGLSVCKRIVEGMGGHIAITRQRRGQRDEGLDRVAAPRNAPAEATGARQAHGGRLRILVIDDEPLVRRAMKMLLAEEHDVEDVPEGDAGLAMIRDTRYDVILCDLMMPGMTGRDVYERIREQSPGLARRMVFVTGGAFVPMLAKFLESVDNLKLSKPFTEADVLGAVAAAAAR